MADTTWNLLGVDTGGTFTDLVLSKDGQLHIYKVLSTPHMPEQAIIEGMRALGIDLTAALDLIHGSTVATNAVLEGKGAKTAYVSNRGFGDILTLGRQARDDIYDLTPVLQPPPVPQELCLETGGRIDHAGVVIEDLSVQDLSVLQKQLRELAPESVAINFLFSFVDDRFEKAVAEVLENDGYFVSCSSSVLSEQREYERGIATWLNCFVGPVMRRYLMKLSRLLSASNIRVMQSHGKTIQADKAGDHAVNLLLSGPAAGVMAVHQIAALSGYRKALSFDMGGTSTDVSMIDGGVMLTNNGCIRQYPISVPMVDIHTIGAGGSSIAYLDPGGMLRVGPQSAAAVPGPACYGKGGNQPTITDAHLLLNHLPEILGDHLRLDRAAAKRVFAPLADALGMDIAQTAQGVIDIVNEQMTQALYVMSAQRGCDPAEFLLVGFGAAGGLHICTLAENIKIREALVPVYAGVLSALGMLTAEQGLQRSQTVCRLLEQTSADNIENIFQRLAEQADAEMAEQSIAATDRQVLVDLRYQGQWHCLTLQRRPIETLIEDFHCAHEKLHGYRLDVPVELVTAKVQVTAAATLKMDAVLKGYIPAPACADDHRRETADTPLFRRDALGEQVIQGPAIISEMSATTYVKTGWQAHLDKLGNLCLRAI